MEKIKLCPVCKIGRYKKTEKSFVSLKSHIINSAKSEIFEKAMGNVSNALHFDFYKQRVFMDKKRKFNL